MKRKNMLALVTVVLLCLPLTSGADIYQYMDKNGVMHFTNVDGSSKHHRRIPSSSRKRRKTAFVQKSLPPSATPASPLEIPGTYAGIIDRTCERYGVDPSLVRAIVKVESDFNPYALSKKGAMGLMQLMPQTAINMNIRNSFNPRENIEGGVKYLRHLIDQYEGNLSLALAAYNAGETAVQRWGSVPPFKETREYVRRILKIYNGGNGSFATTTNFTIYMGYGEDGSLLITDNPSNHPNRNLRRRKIQRSL